MDTSARIHKVTPNDRDELHCKFCRQPIKRVPGGQGTAWIHADSGAVAAPNPHAQSDQDVGETTPTMKKFIVRISRTEEIRFQIEATSPADAEARYLLDGDETDSDTLGIEVLDVVEDDTTELDEVVIVALTAERYATFMQCRWRSGHVWPASLRRTDDGGAEQDCERCGTTRHFNARGEITSFSFPDTL